MWRAWNSRKHTETSPQQLFYYMKYIQLSLTKADVFKKILKCSQVVGEKCGRKYALDIYDLAIAKILNRIQRQETPQFDNFLSCLVLFILNWHCSHLKFIGGSGGLCILLKSSVVAVGSMSKFLRRNK